MAIRLLAQGRLRKYDLIDPLDLNRIIMPVQSLQTRSKGSCVHGL